LSKYLKSVSWNSPFNVWNIFMLLALFLRLSPLCPFHLSFYWLCPVFILVFSCGLIKGAQVWQFELAFFTVMGPIWVGDMRTEPKIDFFYHIIYHIYHVLVCLWTFKNKNKSLLFWGTLSLREIVFSKQSAHSK
jgi:hypothetical protein